MHQLYGLFQISAIIKKRKTANREDSNAQIQKKHCFRCHNFLMFRTEVSKVTFLKALRRVCARATVASDAKMRDKVTVPLNA